MRTAHALLVSALVVAGFVACGGQAPQPQTGPSPAVTGETPGQPPPTVVPGPASPGGSASASAPEGLPPARVEMKPLIPSAMLDDLRGLGIDPANLPPIEKLEPRMLRGVMKIMAKSLGAKCGDCHQEGDFAAPTRRKKIAAHMWDDFAAKLSLEGGQPVFCDSCHEGRMVLLDRSDKKVLAKWMDDTFVAKLGRKDGKSGTVASVECETCHVNMEMHFLAKWGQ